MPLMVPRNSKATRLYYRHLSSRSFSILYHWHIQLINEIICILIYNEACLCICLQNYEYVHHISMYYLYTRILTSIMTVEFYIKYIFYNADKKSISESKKNKSINENYLVCYCTKNHNFHVPNLELSEKLNCLIH